MYYVPGMAPGMAGNGGNGPGMVMSREWSPGMVPGARNRQKGVDNGQIQSRMSLARGGRPPRDRQVGIPELGLYVFRGANE